MMCSALFTQAPLRPGWYHVCPFQICTHTHLEGEGKTKNIPWHFRRGLNPTLNTCNMRRRQNSCEAVHFEIEQIRFEIMNQLQIRFEFMNQLHHDRKHTPREHPEASQTSSYTLIFSQSHVGHHGAATIAT